VAETTWGEEAPSAPPTKSIPTWVWFCGAGCLVMLVIGIALLVFGMSFMKKAMDPETQWRALAEVLPYDERPPEMTPKMGMNTLGVKQVTLIDTRGYQIQIQEMGGAKAQEAREQLFEKDPPEFPKEMLGVFKFSNVRSSLAEVQGRKIHVVRMKPEFEGIAKSMVPKAAQDQMGNMLWADVTPEGRDDLVFIQIQRQGPSARDTDGGDITDADLRDILKPFHVGPKR
jgi:hypothetical protein